MSTTHSRGAERALYLAAIGAACVVAGPLWAQQEDNSDLEEVIVTAQKRAQPLQEVPISITTLTGEQLAAMKVDSGMEITKFTPNFRASVAGNEDQPKYTIRGLSQFDFNLNASSPTGVFYDEIYVASQFLGGPQTFDLQRIEVLRGPQGTLFGKNTVGGAVNFLSRAPRFDGEAHSHVALDAGSNDYYRIEAATDVPLVADTLTARVAVNTTQSDGWVRNVNTTPGSRDMSSIDSRAVRFSLAYRSADFDANLRLWGTRSNPTAIGIIEYGMIPTDFAGTTPPIDARVNPFTGEPLGSHEAAYDQSGQIKVKGSGVNLTVNKTLGAYTLTSISSYLSGDFANSVDGDGSISDFFRLNFLASTQETSQDLRLTSQYVGRFNFITGLYFFHDRTDTDTTLLFFGNGAPTTYTQLRTSFAAYIDGTYNITPKAQFFLGIRETHEKGEIKRFRNFGFNEPEGFADYSETEPSGRVGVRYRAAEDLMFYGQASRGYRSSGINGGAGCNAELNVAKPEFLNAFEVGFKSELVNRRVLVNGDVFYYDFKDQQFRSSIAANETCPNPFAPPGAFNALASKLLNAAKSRTYGAELETRAHFTNRLSVMFGAGWLDTKYKDLVLHDGTQDVDLGGNKMLEAPPYTALLGLDYWFPVGSMSINLHADANWTGKQFYTAFNTQTSSAPAHWESAARVSLRSKHGKYEFGIWGKNLNDNTADTWVVENPGTKFTTIPYPRRYGADFRWNF